jgi:tRNA (guanine37-N1)-methyltransferase
MIKFHIVTIFPEPVRAYLSESILKKAIENKKISVDFYNPLDWAEASKNPQLKKPIDDKPFGGGPGMVLKAEPFLEAIKKAIGRKSDYQIVYFSPRGKTFDTKMAKNFAQTFNQNNEKKFLSFLKNGFSKKDLDKNIILVSGRYEGVDSRVLEVYPGEEISVGDFVLTGGELPAMILIDSISRQISGVLGNFDSREEERISAGKYYTRPEVLS